MRTACSLFNYFYANEEGATAVEYGLMIALITAVIIVAVTLLGTNLKDIFEAIAGKIGAAKPA